LVGANFTFARTDLIRVGAWQRGTPLSIEQRAEDLRWYAVRANPQQEERAAGNLDAWGVETFSPRLKKGRRNEFTGVVTYFSKPMFPGYLFARFDAERLLHKVWYTRGVHSVIGFGGSPAPIDDEVLELLQAQVGEDGYVRLGDELNPGDKIVVTQGPLKNFVGVFERRMKGSERVMMLLDTVNYHGRLVVESDAVKKAAA
jgi:transcriptional antiterminator RfaH